MRSKSKFLSLAAMGGLAGLALISTSTAASATIQFRVCNHTDQTVLVATSYIPVGGSNWRNKGWSPVNAGACSNVFTTNNATFYARAEVKGDSSQYWGSDIKQCVEYPGPYDFYTRSEDTTCPEGEPADFTTFHTQQPTYTWNLNP